MEILSDPTPDMLAMPWLDDGAIDMQELLRRLAEQVVNAVMDAEADQLRGGGANSRNGCRERALATCAGTLTPRIPKLRTGSFFPDDAIERHRRVGRALVAAVAETCATGASTRKVRRVAEKMGVSRLSKDQASAIASSLDADVGELCGRPLGCSPAPCVRLGATYAKRRREGRVASTAAVAAIGRDAGGRRRVLGVDAVDTESHGSRLAFLRKVRGRGVSGAELVVSDARPGLVRALGEVFQGAAWQRCAVRLMRDCMREAGSWRLGRRAGRIVSQAFRGRGAATVTAMCRAARAMPEGCCPGAAAVLEEAEPDALACLDLPPSHRKRLRADNVQERASREIKRRPRVVQVSPPDGIAGEARRRGHVRAGRDTAGAQVLLGGEDERALRRGARARNRREGRLGAARGRGQEDARARPRACGQGRGGIGYQTYSRFPGAGQTRFGSGATPTFPTLPAQPLGALPRSAGRGADDEEAVRPVRAKLLAFRPHGVPAKQQDLLEAAAERYRPH